MQSDSHPKVYVISHIRKLTAEETRNFLEPLATWVLVLALALGVVIAALSLVAWWDDLSPGANFPGDAETAYYWLLLRRSWISECLFVPSHGYAEVTDVITTLVSQRTE